MRAAGAGGWAIALSVMATTAFRSACAAGGAAPAPVPGAPIKIDKTGLLLPLIPPSMGTKPQIIVEREGPISKTEQQHQSLAAETPCELKQGFVLLQKNLDNSGIFKFFLKYC